MRRSGFRRPWRKACDKAAVTAIEAAKKSGTRVRPEVFDGLVFHELRHTVAALAIAQGAHPVAIKERLGHSSITVTMHRYGGLFPHPDEAIAEGLDEVLRYSLAARMRPEVADGAHFSRSGA